MSEKMLNQININKTKPEFAYLIGVMLGDGYLIKPYKRDYRICLKTIDKDFALNFKNKFTKIYNSKPHFFKEKNESCRQKFHYKIMFINKNAYLDIQKVKNNYQKYLIKTSKINKINFLNGIYDSEGCITNKKYSNRIILNNQNYKLIKLVQNLLKQLNIETKIYKTLKKKKKYYELNIQKKQYFPIFKKNINICIKRKQNRLKNLIS